MTRLDDPESIVLLLGQVITVNLETVKLVKTWQPLELTLNSAKPQT